MKYTLMHKQIAVAGIDIDNATGSIQKSTSCDSPEHLPVGVLVRQGGADRAALNQWWTTRSIPASRLGIGEALESMNIPARSKLLVLCHGLSLSDQYWILPDGSNLTWDKINFFQNDFSDDIGDILFGTCKNLNVWTSVRLTTLRRHPKKRWKIINGARCLIKGGSNPFHQQPFNEVISAGIMERLGISHVPYTLAWNQGVPYSVCEDFVTETTELIPAWRIVQTPEKKQQRLGHIFTL